MVKQIVVKLESPSIGRIITKLKGVSNKKNKEYASPISSRLGASHLLNLHYILKPAAPLIFIFCASSSAADRMLANVPLGAGEKSMEFVSSANFELTTTELSFA